MSKQTLECSIIPQFLLTEASAKSCYRQWTDVVVLAVSVVILPENTEIWIAVGTRKHLRYIRAHDIPTMLGKKKVHVPLLNRL